MVTVQSEEKHTREYGTLRCNPTTTKCPATNQVHRTSVPNVSSALAIIGKHHMHTVRTHLR